jgi:hypothetical protein
MQHCQYPRDMTWLPAQPLPREMSVSLTVPVSYSIRFSTDDRIRRDYAAVFGLTLETAGKFTFRAKRKIIPLFGRNDAISPGHTGEIS